MPHHWGESGEELKQGRTLDTEADAEALDECCLVVCYPWLAQPASLQHPEPPSLGGTTHSDLNLPTSIKKCCSSLFTGQSNGSIFSVEIFLFQNDSRLRHINKKPNPMGPFGKTSKYPPNAFFIHFPIICLPTPQPSNKSIGCSSWISIESLIW